MRVDLPLPVLPTMPVFIPPGKVHVRPRNTSGMCGAYRTYIAPLASVNIHLTKIIAMNDPIHNMILFGDKQLRTDL